MKLDRTTALGISAIFLIISLFIMNTTILFIALLLFVGLVFYNMNKNMLENKLLKLSKEQKLFCIAICALGIFGIAMALMGLLLL